MKRRLLPAAVFALVYVLAILVGVLTGRVAVAYREDAQRHRFFCKVGWEVCK